jgi:hypothetical protein
MHRHKTTKTLLWRELLWRRPIVILAVVVLFLSTADWLWDELLSPLNWERPKLLNILGWLPWYGWTITGLLIVVFLIHDHAYKLIHEAEADRDQANSELVKERSRPNNSLDWGGEWKLAQDGFAPYRNSGVKAQHQHESSKTSVTDTWSFAGGDNMSRSDVEAWCMRAGALLLTTPGFSTLISEKTAVCSNDVERWLEYMKEKYPLGDTLLLEGINKEERYWTSVGFIEDLAAGSASECVKCASMALRFKQLW